MSAQPPPPDGLFPIRTVAQLTGVNPITLRAWERRYGLIKPLRTAKGHRLYRTEDIQTIHRILALLEQGMAIGQVGRMLASTPPAQAASVPVGFLADYRAALGRLDETELDRLEVDALGFAQPDALLLHILLPLLDELGQRQADDLGLQAQYVLLKARVMFLLQQRLRALRPLEHTHGSCAVLLVSLPPERGGLTALRLAHALALKRHAVHLPPPGLHAALILELAQRLAPTRIVLLLEDPLPAAVRGTQLPLLAQGRWPLIAVGSRTGELADFLEQFAIPYAQGSISSLAALIHDQLMVANLHEEPAHAAP